MNFRSGFNATGRSQNIQTIQQQSRSKDNRNSNLRNSSGPSLGNNRVNINYGHSNQAIKERNNLPNDKNFATLNNNRKDNAPTGNSWNRFQNVSTSNYRQTQSQTNIQGQKPINLQFNKLDSLNNSNTNISSSNTQGLLNSNNNFVNPNTVFGFSSSTAMNASFQNNGSFIHQTQNIANILSNNLPPIVPNSNDFQFSKKYEQVNSHIVDDLAITKENDDSLVISNFTDNPSRDNSAIVEKINKSFFVKYIEMKPCTLEELHNSYIAGFIPTEPPTVV